MTFSGDVLNEAKYELNSLQRVDNLIAVANQPPEGVSDSRFLMNEVFRRSRLVVGEEYSCNEKQRSETSR